MPTNTQNDTQSGQSPVLALAHGSHLKTYENQPMKTFEKDYKINFVDDANVLVGFDNSQNCCESFGYFLSRKIPTKIDDGAEEIDTEGFNFDTKFFQEVTPAEEYFDCGGMVVFRLTKGAEEIFLTLYNSHNGYYSHGFEMTVGGTQIHDGSL